MKKIFLTGDNAINEELRVLISGKTEFVTALDNSVDIIIDSANFPLNKKIENISYIDNNCSSSIPVLTSSLCYAVSGQTTASKYPNRLIGIGLYPSISDAKLIEIAPSKITDKNVLEKTENILKECGLEYEIVPDRTGLILPRVLAMIINEAVQVFAEKTASLEDIDTAMKLGTNYPYGPLEWADKLGIELVYNILLSLQRDFGEDRYRPHPLLKEMTDLKKKFYE